MEPSDIRGRAIECVQNVIGVGDVEITEKAHFINDLGADSLDVVEIVMEFEEEFDILIEDEEAEKIMTFGAALEYVTLKLRKAGR